MTLSRLVLFLIIAVLTCPLFAMRVGSPYDLAAPAIEPAPFHRDKPRVASNGEGFLAVWADYRSGSSADIRATRINVAGEVIDPLGIRIAAGPGIAGTVAVASDGRDYLVAFGCGFMTVCVSHVDAVSGVVTTASRIEDAENPALASNGGSYLLSYLARGANGVQTRFTDVLEVGRNGARISAPVRLGEGVYPPVVTSNGRKYLVTWSTHADLQFAVVSEELAIERGNTITGRRLFGPGMFSWAAESDGRDFMLVYQLNVGTAQNGYVTTLLSRHISADGALADPVTIAPPEQRAWDPAIAWDGARFVVSYTAVTANMGAPYILRGAEGDLRSVTLSRAGEIEGGPAVVASRPRLTWPSAVASTHGSTLVVWRHVTPSERFAEIEATLFGSATVIGVSRSLAWQQSPAGTSDGVRRLLVWEEISGDSRRKKIVLQRIDHLGLPLDGRGIPVAESSEDQIAPAVAGSLVAWIEQQPESTSPATVVVGHLGRDGLRETGPVPIGAAARDARVSVGASAEGYLVAWESPSRSVVGVRISSRGEPLDAQPFVVSSSERGDWAPAVASDGENYLVIWNRNESAEGLVCAGICYPPASLQAAFVTARGVVAPAVPIGSSRLDASYSSLVWNGEEYAAFWSGFERPLTSSLLLARPLTRFGIPLGPAERVDEHAYLNGAAWNGSSYVVAWTRGRYNYGRIPLLTLTTLDRTLRSVQQVILSQPHMTDPSDPYAPRPLGSWNVALLFLADGGGVIAHRAPGEDGVSRVVGRLLDGATTVRRRSAARR